MRATGDGLFERIARSLAEKRACVYALFPASQSLCFPLIVITYLIAIILLVTHKPPRFPLIVVTYFVALILLVVNVVYQHVMA